MEVPDKGGLGPLALAHRIGSKLDNRFRWFLLLFPFQLSDHDYPNARVCDANVGRDLKPDISDIGFGTGI